MCSSSGTPISAAPWVTSSRLTPRAKALSLSFFLTLETSRSGQAARGTHQRACHQEPAQLVHREERPGHGGVTGHAGVAGVPQDGPLHRLGQPPLPPAGAPLRRGVPRSASGRRWESARSRNRGAGPPAPRPRGPRPARAAIARMAISTAYMCFRSASDAVYSCIRARAWLAGHCLGRTCAAVSGTRVATSPSRAISKAYEPGTGQGNIEDQHRTGLNVHHAGGRLAELHRALATQQLRRRRRPRNGSGWCARRSRCAAP